MASQTPLILPAITTITLRNDPPYRDLQAAFLPWSRICLHAATVAWRSCGLQVGFRSNTWRSGFPGHVLVMAGSRDGRIQAPSFQHV